MPELAPKLPFFIGLGAQKAGTTTLQRQLEQHPEVWLPQSKELHYFSLHYARGTEWYAGCFAGAGRGQRTGDITPYYLFHPAVPARLAALLPRARLVILLRDPVARSLSQYFHSRRLGLEPLPLEQALAAETVRLDGAEDDLQRPDGRHRSHQEHSYVARSRYEEQLARYEDRFPAQQLLICRSEDLFQDPAGTWARLLSFLELDPRPLPPGQIVANAGAGEAEGVPTRVREWLREQLAPTYQTMEARYGMVW